MTDAMRMIQMIRKSNNPYQAIMQAAQQNPGLQQVLNMANGKTPAEMRELALNLANQRGIDIDALAQQMGIKLPG